MTLHRKVIGNKLNKSALHPVNDPTRRKTRGVRSRTHRFWSRCARERVGGRLQRHGGGEIDVATPNDQYTRRTCTLVRRRQASACASFSVRLFPCIKCRDSSVRSHYDNLNESITIEPIEMRFCRQSMLLLWYYKFVYF